MALWGSALTTRSAHLEEATNAASKSLAEWLVCSLKDLDPAHLSSGQVSQELLHSFTQLIGAQREVFPSAQQLKEWQSDWKWSSEYIASVDLLIRHWNAVAELWKKARKKKIEHSVMEAKLYQRYAVVLATYGQALHYKRTAVRPMCIIVQF